ncbi:MAG: cyclic nucleotide-binding domain-containing protein [Burkholderiales bacterium]
MFSAQFEQQSMPSPVTAVEEYGLTASEKEVLELAARGYQNAEIAQHRHVSVGTVKAQMHSIFEKLGTRNRFEAALLYRIALSVDLDEQRRAEEGEFDFSWLNQVALSTERWPKGHVLFQQGDLGDKLYYITQGRVRLKEKKNVIMGPRDLFGEIAVFTDGHRRTFTAVCETNVNLLTMTREQVRRCYRVYPQFAIYILFSIIRRLMADRS